jgi:hypothetical protein
MTMRAIEFKTKIKNDQIQIPAGVQLELSTNRNNDIRVIVLIDDIDKREDMVFDKTVKDHFLEGYAESDSLYDNY